MARRSVSDNTLGNVFQGDFLVDIRLQKSYRAFIDLNLGYVTNGAPVGHAFTLQQPFGAPLPPDADPPAPSFSSPKARPRFSA